MSGQAQDRARTGSRQGQDRLRTGSGQGQEYDMKVGGALAAARPAADGAGLPGAGE